jgi:hypothetical protein
LPVPGTLKENKPFIPLELIGTTVSDEVKGNITGKEAGCCVVKQQLIFMMLTRALPHARVGAAETIKFLAPIASADAATLLLQENRPT